MANPVQPRVVLRLPVVLCCRKGPSPTDGSQCKEKRQHSAAGHRNRLPHGVLHARHTPSARDHDMALRIAPFC